jgi:hypothetical protein
MRLLDEFCRGRVVLPTFGYRTVRAAGGGPLLDERFGYSVEEGLVFLDRLGDAGREAYARFLRLDLVVMVVLGGAGLVVLVGWLRRRLAPEQQRLDWLVLAPVAMSLFDAVEDVAILTALSDPATAAVTIGAASHATVLKHVLGRVLIPGLGVGLIWLGIRRIRSRRGP